MKSSSSTEIKKLSKEESFWMYCFLLIPAVALPNFANLISDSGTVAISAALGGMGAVLGYLLNYLTKDKSRSIKFVTAFVMLSGLISMFFILGNRTTSDKKNLFTCEVCGYKTLEFKGAECPICLTELTTSFRKEAGFDSMDSFIIDEQGFFFEDEKLDSPSIYKAGRHTYSKDKNWKPLIAK